MTVARKLAVLGAGTAAPGPGPSAPWLARRLFPVLATAVLLVIGMCSTIWWGPAMAGRTAWALPDDLWGTLAAASRLLHLHLGGLYTQPTGLVTLPGAAVILIPVVAVADLAGIPLAIQSAHNPQPAVWLLAGPYVVALSAVALFAADAIAEHLGTPWFRRAARQRRPAATAQPQATRIATILAGPAAITPSAICGDRDAHGVGWLIAGKFGWLVTAA